MLDKLSTLDRRVIHLLVFLAVVVPLVFPLGFPLQVSEPVHTVYDFIERLPRHSLVWFGFDFWATTRAETAPGAIVVARHLLRRGHRLVITSTIPDGALISQTVMRRLAREEGKTYGVDYAILGYKAGNQMAIKQMCTNLHAAFPTDIDGCPLDDMPVTRAFRNFHDVAMVFTASDTTNFDQYAVVAHTQFGLPVAGASTAVLVPALSPYVNAGQILGVLGGLKGAAEYEKLTSTPGEATRGMDAQSVVHMLIVALIAISNATYFAARRRPRA